ncbi:SAM-dependent methyltransferase [Couchioplanes caeruleus]|uniref:SAM-dependent methyltransferase n=1 Tax=Couchioplanes caeruleus TaxID=56438 RepID=UPI0020BDF2FB|nr:SAM-dependent methyltransferase [Couchioplanes caeruleus]UQU61417.1 SAM-dependent methyltransferase [Couchioplanes caeruleus]
MDWAAWHDDYDDPASALARRLDWVRAAIRTWLETAPPGPLTVISLCAGQGRDLIGALAGHPRAGDVHALLVETDPRNAACARDAAGAAGLTGIEVVQGDAGRTDQYADAAPAHLVLACGVFGNISDVDVSATISACAALCREGGTVVWTRHRRPPDLVPVICEWFETRGFARVAVTGDGFGAGVHRRVLPAARLAPGVRMFTFRDRR